MELGIAALAILIRLVEDPDAEGLRRVELLDRVHAVLETGRAVGFADRRPVDNHMGDRNLGLGRGLAGIRVLSIGIFVFIRVVDMDWYSAGIRIATGVRISTVSWTASIRGLTAV